MTDSRMKEYEAYKDSEIEWIGQIPKEWEVIKIKNLCNVTDGTHFSPRTESTGKPYVTVSNVNNDFVDVGNALLISEEDFDTLVRQGCQPKVGDVLLSKDGTVGRSAIVGNNNGFVCLSSLGILSPKAGLFSGYLKRSLDSIMLQYQMNRAMAGSALKRITISKINEFCMLLPPLSEQKAIAFYLDYKVGQIDASISAINTQIDDLKSYRQSIISEAVTKGLNPDVPMKDSCVEWIEQIPEGWEIKRLSLFTTKIGSGKTPTGGAQVYTEDGVLFIRSQNVYNNGLLTNDIAYISEEVNRTMVNSKVVHQDVLLNITGGSIGRSCLITDENINANVNQHVCIIRSKKNVLDSSFLHYQIVSSLIQNQIKACQTGSNREELNFEQIGKFMITIPPLSEQQEIATYLNTKTQKIDAAIVYLEQQRNDLNTLKQSIISEAVTGKIDVRDWKPNK